MDLNFGKKVLFATRERIQNRWRFKEIDDKGVLSTTDDGIRFEGKRHDFEVSKIQAMSMVKSSPALATAITTPPTIAAIYFVFGWFFRLLFEGSGASFFDIGIEHVIQIIGSSVFLVIMSFFMMRCWICVEYRGADGQPREAFFRRLPGRKTEALLNQLRELTVEEK